MTDYQSYVSQLQKQSLSAMHEVGEVQAKLLEAVRTVPTTFGDTLPSATEIAEKSFDFATQVHNVQWDIALKLVNAARVTPPKAASKRAA
jgi:hypothetical protein